MRVRLLMVMVLCLSACKEKAPPVSLELHDGNIVYADAWKGRWVYINYWAVWCKPCAEEIPALNAFAKNNPDDVLVLGVNFDKVADVTLLSQINGFHIDYSVVISDIQTAFKHPIPQGLPATVVFNPEGQLVTTLSGPQTEAGLQAVRKH